MNIVCCVHCVDEAHKIDKLSYQQTDRQRDVNAVENAPIQTQSFHEANENQNKNKSAPKKPRAAITNQQTDRNSSYTHTAYCMLIFSRIGILAHHIISRLPTNSQIK